MEGSPSNNFDAASIIPNVTPWTLLTVTPLLSPRRGLIYFNRNCKDGLFNLAKKIVSELSRTQKGKVQLQEAGGHTTEDQKQIRTSSW